MKATGIIRRLDELGRIVIPKELRRTLNLHEGSAVEFYTDKDTICLKKYSYSCSCCGATGAEVELHNPFNPSGKEFVYPEPPEFYLCDRCMKKLKNALCEKGDST